MPRTQLRSVNQQALDRILANYTPKTKLATLLSGLGYSSDIKNIKINVSQGKEIDFSDCHFTQVSFSGKLQYSVFEHTTFDKVTMNNADLSHSLFSDVQFNHSTVSNSNFNSTSFIDSKLNNHVAFNCDFSNSSFADSHINKANFAKSKFENALDFNNAVHDIHVVFNQQYQKQDYVFANANEHQIKPTVVVVDDSEWHDTPFYVINEFGGQAQTINQYNENINDFRLAREVASEIQNIYYYGLHADSIAQQVIRSNLPTIKAIRDYAYDVMKHADALWIPGGPDLHPEFYGERTTQSYPSGSYYREILEFSLANAAIAMDKPILGICHGSQLMNVYLGGSLHQHVDTPYGHVNLTAHTDKGLLGSIIDSTLIGPSFHHQAVKDVAKSLEVVASYNGVIKATQATDGKKIMLCQFHPEYKADRSSINILNKFLDLSGDQKMKTTTIALGDVIDNHNAIAGLEAIPANNPVPHTHHLTPYSASAVQTSTFDSVMATVMEMLV